MRRWIGYLLICPFVVPVVLLTLFCNWGRSPSLGAHNLLGIWRSADGAELQFGVILPRNGASGCGYATIASGMGPDPSWVGQVYITQTVADVRPVVFFVEGNEGEWEVQLQSRGDGFRELPTWPRPVPGFEGQTTRRFDGELVELATGRVFRRVADFGPTQAR